MNYFRRYFLCSPSISAGRFRHPMWGIDYRRHPNGCVWFVLELGWFRFMWVPVQARKDWSK